MNRITQAYRLLCLLTLISFSFTAPAQLSLNIMEFPPNCFGEMTGSAIAMPSGGTSPYTYLWDTGETTSQISNLGPGQYGVTVTDAAMQTITGIADLAFSPELEVGIAPSDLCSGISDLTAVVAGGTPPYGYFWSTGASTQEIQGAPPGTYTVTVTDDLYCQVSASIVVPFALEAQLITQDISCWDVCDGLISVVPIGGTPPYTYLWNEGYTDSLVFALHPGYYEVTVTDSNGCTVVGGDDVIAPPELILSINAPILPCGAGPIGTATATPIGGTPPYAITWSNGQSGMTATGLVPGETYMVNVFDANGCFLTASVEIETETSIEAAVFTTDAVCGDPMAGAAFAMGSEGTPPYSYLWNTGDTTISVTGLPAGTYTVTITDVNGCLGVASGEVEDAPADIDLTFDGQSPSTCTAFDGAIWVTAEGGTPPYTYLWNTGSTSDTLSGVLSGIYFVTVTDANNCPVEGVWELENNNNLGIDLVQEGSCIGDAQVIATALEGTAPFDFVWNTGQTGDTIAVDSSGTYVVTMTDSQGCTGLDSIEVFLFVGPTIDVSGTNPSCLGENDGTAQVMLIDSLHPVDYLWNTGAMTNSITGLGPGVYSVTATDTETGCQTIDSVELFQPDSLYVLLTISDPLCNGDANGSIMADVIGANFPIYFEWSNGDTGLVLTDLPAGTYTGTVTDSNGCAAITTATLVEPEVLSLSLDVEHPGCLLGNDGSITTSAAGGTMPYSYLWNTGDTTPDLQDLVAGFYSVTLTDANGCSSEQSVELVEENSPQVTIDALIPSCAGAQDGSLTAVINGGTPPHAILWSTGDTTATISDLGAGFYEVSVTDAEGCTGVAGITLTEPTAISLNVTVTEVPCFGESTGSIQVEATGGTPPYMYEWDTGATGPILTDVPSGVYGVTATDANGCEATGQVELGQNAEILIETNVLSTTCLGGATGSAEAIASGGTGPYTYEWSNGETTAIATALPVGTSTVQVTDAVGCKAITSVDIMEETDPFDCEAYVVQPISTFDGADGSVGVLDPDDQTGPFTYAWNNGETTQIISGLPAGVYEVTVTDGSNGCISVCSVELVNPSKVGNFVWEDTDNDGQQDPGEAGVDGIQVTLSGFDQDGNLVELMTTTSGGGMYVFDGLAPGMYQVIFSNLPTDYVFTLANVGDDETDSDAQFANGGTAFFMLNASECNLTIDAGIYIECINVTDPGEIAGDEYLCGPGNDPGPITEVAPPVGGVGDLEFLWMYSTEPGPFDPGTWIIIPNSDVPEYDPGIIYETTYYARCVRRENCTEYLESNIIVKEVGTEAVAQINVPGTICVDDVVVVSGLDNGPGAQYDWDFGNDAIPATSTQLSELVTWTSFGLKTIQLVVTNNDCVSQVSVDIIVSNADIICGDAIADDPITFDFPFGNLSNDPDSRAAGNPYLEASMLYPNPTANACYLQRPTGQSEWTIDLLDYSGRVLQHKQWAENAEQEILSLEAHQPGLYFVRLTDEEGFQHVLRVVRQ